MAENVDLASIYRQKNPYDRNVETTAAMLPRSGYAAPFLAYVMGRDTAQAGEWDNEREQKVIQMLNSKATSEAEKALNERKVKLFGDIVNIGGSKFDDETKRMLISERAGLEQQHGGALEGIDVSNIGFSKDDNGSYTHFTVPTKDGKGLQLIINSKTSGITDIAGKPVPPEVLATIGQPPKAPETVSYQEGTEKVTDIYQVGQKVKTAKGPMWEKKDTGAKSVSDILDDIRSTSSAIAQVENEGLTNKLLATYSTNPKIAEALKESPNREGAKTSLSRLLQIYKADYQKLTGKPYDASATPAPQEAQPAVQPQGGGMQGKSEKGMSISDVLKAGGKIKRDPKTGKDFVFDAQGNLIGTVTK